jgi:hypothetical protein
VPERDELRREGLPEEALRKKGSRPLENRRITVNQWRWDHHAGPDREDPSVDVDPRAQLPQACESGRPQTERLVDHRLTQLVVAVTEALAELPIPGEPLSDPCERDRGGFLGRREHDDELVGDRPGTGIGPGPGDVVEDALALALGMAPAAFDLFLEKSDDRCEPPLEDRVQERPHGALVTVGRRKGRVARRSQQRSHAIGDCPGPILVGHSEDRPDEDLLGQRPHSREQQEGPAARPLREVAVGDLRDLRRHPLQALRGERWFDPGSRLPMLLTIGSKD